MVVRLNCGILIERRWVVRAQGMSVGSMLALEMKAPGWCCTIFAAVKCCGLLLDLLICMYVGGVVVISEDVELVCS